MKTKVLGVFFAFVLVILVWNGESLTAMAEEYSYEDKYVQTAEGTEVVKQWYKGPWADKVEIDGPPAVENLEGAQLKIETAPDAETDTWLKGLSGDLEWCDISVNVPDDVTVQIGTPENEISNYICCVKGGIAKFYGDAISGSVTVDYQKYTAQLYLYGNVEYLSLGMQDPRESLAPINGSAYVEGNVTGQLNWIKTYQTEDGDTENPRYYTGYSGSATVTGTVAGGVIKETVWDPSLESDIWYDSGVIGNCAAGTFKIENGVMAQEVPVTAQEPVFREYEYQYWVTTMSDGVSCKTVWQRYVFYKDTHEYAAWQNDYDPAKVPEDSYITIVGLGEPLVWEKDIARLEIANSGQHSPKEAVINLTVKGDVGELMLDIYRVNDISVKVEGDVEYATINYRYNKGANVSVTGKVHNAVHNAIFPTGTLTVGKFSMENMPMIINGIWNPALLFYASQDEGAIAYAPVNQENVTSALKDDTLEKEFTISTPEGEKTLVKEATVLVEQTDETTMNEVEQMEEMTETMENLEEQLAEIYEQVLSMESVCGVDISVGTQYVDVQNGNSYTGDSNYAAEEINELQEGNDLPFTVKIPEEKYDENKHYTVIREHRNPDGSVRMDVLETTRDGDRVSFKSDKFSTFMIIASEVEEKEGEPIPTPEPTPTPEPNPTPAPAPTQTPTQATATTTQKPTNAYPVPTTVLRIGTVQREAVRWLQTELSQAGYQLVVDGMFGRETRAALMDYQLRHGLIVDGICGKMTINALLNDGSTTASNASNSNSVPAGLVKVGHKNQSEVRWVQTELRQAGYNLVIDGLFGQRTRATLMDYQLRHGLKVDGICGPQTIQSMLAK